jgi:hypothetical protein
VTTDRVDNLHHSLRDLKTSLIAIYCSRYRPAISRQSLKVGKWRFCPITGPQDDRDQNGLSRPVSFYCALSLNLIAVTRLYEVRADEEKDDPGFVDALINRLFPPVTRGNHSVIPLDYAAVALMNYQLTPHIIH